MWKQILEIPLAQNPFGAGSPQLCVDLGGAIAPFSANGADITCTVKPGTKIFVAAWSAECSTMEVDDFFGSNEAELRTCAARVNSGITTVRATLDGRQVALTTVTSPLEHLSLPAGNLFGLPPGTGPPGGLSYESVANGWVALLHPLTPGTHAIEITATGDFPIPHSSPLDVHNTTTIIVKPGLH
jgi:hypothetical protein